MRDTIEKNINLIAFKLQFEGLFKTMQYFLLGNSKNVCPDEYKW